MIKFLAHDTVNDVALIQTAHSGPDFHVRYGLQVLSFDDLDSSLSEYFSCIEHALAARGDA